MKFLFGSAQKYLVSLRFTEKAIGVIIHKWTDTREQNGVINLKKNIKKFVNFSR